MPDHKNRFESMLFNNETSNRIEYKEGTILPIITTKYEEKRACSRIRPRPLKDIHALTDWNRPIVPFDLFGKPKDVLQSDPNVVPKAYGISPDHDRKSVQRSRPRLVITPACSLDDIDDGPRRLLIDSIYLTSQAATTLGAWPQGDGGTVRAPLTGRLARPDPLSLPKLSLPFVSPEWRMDSVGWDNRNLRAFVDPENEFWLPKTTRKPQQ